MAALYGPRGLIVIVATLIGITAGATPKLIAVAPNVFNVNEEETVSVLLKGQNRATVTVSILSKGANQVIHNQPQIKTINKDTQTLFSVRVDGTKLGDHDDNGNYYVQLRVQYPGFDSRSDVLVNKRTGTVFLQTDKTIYSPGQTANIRVFALDEKRRGSNMKIRVEIKNPQDIITRRVDGNTVTGYYSMRHTFSPRPLDGDWSVVASFGRDFTENRTTHIEVRRYVLPHFQMQITDMTQFIDKNTREITGKFNARYSFNAPVVGKATVIFRMVVDGNSENRLQHRVALKNGIGEFKVTNVNTLYDGAAGESFNSLVGNRAKVQVQVVVTEDSTDIKQTAYSPACPIVAKRYAITFEKTPVTFNPGLPFYVKITVKGTSGQPLADKLVAVTVLDQNARNIYRRGESTDENGHAKYIVDVSSNVRSITIKAKLEGNSEETTHTVQKAQMVGYINIRSSQYEVLKPGQTATFEASLGAGQKGNDLVLYYMLVSGGRIFQTAETRLVAEHDITFTLPISYDMAPKVRLVAWYFSRGSIVSSSMLMDVERKCATNAVVSKEGEGDTIEPTKSFELKFEGPIGAKVATLAVDKSVYFLSNRSRLTRKTFFDEFLSRDIGCGPGGGINPMEVFKLAGLTVITEQRAMMTSRREHIDCQGAMPRHRRSTSRSNQATGEQDQAVCCESGERHANGTVLPVNRQSLRTACLRAAKAQTSPSRGCVNAFGRCCVKQAVENAKNQGRSNDEEDDDDDIPFEEDESEATKRVNFKESWMINSDLVIPGEGSVKRSEVAPDTITTWVMQAVTISATEGMCVARPLELVSKMDLFLKVHIPHTAVQGEQIELTTTVYNLHPGDQRVIVKLQGTRGACSDVPVGKWLVQKPSNNKGRVKAGESWTASWRFVPMKTGKLSITAKLISTVANPDIVTRELNVVPSGALVIAPILTITQEPSNPTLGDNIVNNAGMLNYTGTHSISGEKHQQHGTVRLLEPDDALTGTSVMTVKFLGDVMTPIVEGFSFGTEKAMQYARGCGEQTMAFLGPTVFTAKYLRQAGKLTGNLEVEAKKKIEQGIRHMLQYRKPNGGFGVWTTTAPVVWLTAFALKSFAQARHFTDTATDNNILKSAASWLMTQRQPNGMFHRVGFPYHRNMAGGVTAGPALSAYVYSAIMEADAFDRAGIDAAMNHLAVEANPTMSSYELALITLALAKRNHQSAPAVNRMLIAKAGDLPDKVPAQRYWPTNPAQLNDKGSQVEVEVAGYALMAQLALRRPITESNPIVEWLIRQRYGSDLFATTQSTVVSLQALSEYSGRAVKDDLNMKCTLSAGGNTIKTVDITNTNRLVQQKQELTKQLGKYLHIDCEGVGKIHTTIETSYYSTKSAVDICSFDVTVQAYHPNDGRQKVMQIEVCARLKDPKVKMQMPMIEVGIGSGYVPVGHTLDKLVNSNVANVDFYEINERSVVFYLSKIPSHKNLCLQFEVDQEVNVKNLHAVPVKVYAYYEPEKIRCMKFYQPNGDEKALLDMKCETKGNRICKCFEHKCPICYGYNKETQTLPLKTVVDLTLKACGPGSPINFDLPDPRAESSIPAFWVDLAVHAFAMFDATLVDAEQPLGGEMKYTMLINRVAKEGYEKRAELEGQQRIFLMPAKCKTCSYDLNRKYVIMGQDPSYTTQEPKYQLSPETYIMAVFPKNMTLTMSDANRVINKQHKRFLKKMNGCST